MHIKMTSAKTVVGAAAVLVLGMGGAAYAGAMIGNAQLKTGAVDSRVIADHTVHRYDLNADALAPASHTVYVNKFGSVVAKHSGDEAGLAMTGDGVQFGPFANGGGCSTPGSDYARLDFRALDGKTLAQVHQLDYTGWMVADDNTGGVGSLTLRLHMDNGDKLTYSPNTQYNQQADYADSQGEVHTWLVTHGTLRNNDDSGSNPAGELPWQHWASFEGSHKVQYVDVILGCESGTNLQGVMRNFQANGTTYQLGRLG